MNLGSIFRSKPLPPVQPPPASKLPPGVQIEDGFQDVYTYKGFAIAIGERGKLHILDGLFKPGNSHDTIQSAMKEIDLISPWRDTP